MWPPPRRQPKESTLTPTASLPRHRKNPSLIEQRPNIALMKWNSFLENYHSLKQMAMINNSISIVNTHLRERQSSLHITDVPYITSEQAETDSRVSLAQGEVLRMPITMASPQDSVHSLFTEEEPLQNNAVRMSFQIEEIECEQNNIEQPQSSGDSSSQNFTDEEEELGAEEVVESKGMLSTNKNSSAIERWPVWEIEEEEERNQLSESLKKTAFFEAQHANQENIDRSNHSRQAARKVHVQLKVQWQKELAQIREDKRYLGKFLKRKQ